MLHKLFCALLADDVRCDRAKRFPRVRDKRSLHNTNNREMRALIEAAFPHKNVAITPWLTHVASAQASDPGVSTMPQASTFAASRWDLGAGRGVSGLSFSCPCPVLGSHATVLEQHSLSPKLPWQLVVATVLALDAPTNPTLLPHMCVQLQCAWLCCAHAAGKWH